MEIKMTKNHEATVTDDVAEASTKHEGRIMTQGQEKNKLHQEHDLNPCPFCKCGAQQIVEIYWSRGGHWAHCAKIEHQCLSYLNVTGIVIFFGEEINEELLQASAKSQRDQWNGATE